MPPLDDHNQRIPLDQRRNQIEENIIIDAVASEPHRFRLWELSESELEVVSVFFPNPPSQGYTYLIYRGDDNEIYHVEQEFNADAQSYIQLITGLVEQGEFEGSSIEITPNEESLLSMDTTKTVKFDPASEKKFKENESNGNQIIDELNLTIIENNLYLVQSPPSRIESEDQIQENKVESAQTNNQIDDIVAQLEQVIKEKEYDEEDKQSLKSLVLGKRAYKNEEEEAIRDEIIANNKRLKQHQEQRLQQQKEKEAALNNSLIVQNHKKQAQNQQQNQIMQSSLINDIDQEVQISFQQSEQLNQQIQQNQINQKRVLVNGKVYKNVSFADEQKLFQDSLLKGDLREFEVSGQNYKKQIWVQQQSLFEKKVKSRQLGEESDFEFSEEDYQELRKFYCPSDTDSVGGLKPIAFNPETLFNPYQQVKDALTFMSTDLFTDMIKIRKYTADFEAFKKSTAAKKLCVRDNLSLEFVQYERYRKDYASSTIVVHLELASLDSRLVTLVQRQNHWRNYMKSAPHVQFLAPDSQLEYSIAILDQELTGLYLYLKFPKSCDTLHENGKLLIENILKKLQFATPRYYKQATNISFVPLFQDLAYGVSGTSFNQSKVIQFTKQQRVPMVISQLQSILVRSEYKIKLTANANCTAQELYKGLQRFLGEFEFQPLYVMIKDNGVNQYKIKNKINRLGLNDDSVLNTLMEIKRQIAKKLDITTRNTQDLIAAFLCTTDFIGKSFSSMSMLQIATCSPTELLVNYQKDKPFEDIWPKLLEYIINPILGQNNVDKQFVKEFLGDIQQTTSLQSKQAIKEHITHWLKFKLNRDIRRNKQPFILASTKYCFSEMADSETNDCFDYMLYKPELLLSTLFAAFYCADHLMKPIEDQMMTSNHSALMLCGESGQGKSTLQGFIRDLFGGIKITGFNGNQMSAFSQENQLESPLWMVEEIQNVQCIGSAYGKILTDCTSEKVLDLKYKPKVTIGKGVMFVGSSNLCVSSIYYGQESLDQVILPVMRRFTFVHFFKTDFKYFHRAFGKLDYIHQLAQTKYGIFERYRDIKKYFGVHIQKEQQNTFAVLVALIVGALQYQDFNGQVSIPSYCHSLRWQEKLASFQKTTFGQIFLVSKNLLPQLYHNYVKYCTFNDEDIPPQTHELSNAFQRVLNDLSQKQKIKVKIGNQIKETKVHSLFSLNELFWTLSKAVLKNSPSRDKQKVDNMTAAKILDILEENIFQNQLAFQDRDQICQKYNEFGKAFYVHITGPHLRQDE